MTEVENPQEENSIPFYPDHVWSEAKLAIGIFVLIFIVGILGMLMPVGVGDQADPMNTPAHATPEWYFLFLYEALKYIPKTAGVVLPILGLIVIALWPFLDHRPDTLRARRIRIILAVVVLAGIIALTLMAEFT